MKVPTRVVNLINDLDKGFWYKWAENINSFPDTDDGQFLSLFAAEEGIITIFANFILGFPAHSRKKRTNEFIQEIKRIEKELTDFG